MRAEQAAARRAAEVSSLRATLEGQLGEARRDALDARGALADVKRQLDGLLSGEWLAALEVRGAGHQAAPWGPYACAWPRDIGASEFGRCPAPAGGCWEALGVASGAKGGCELCGRALFLPAACGAVPQRPCVCAPRAGGSGSQCAAPWGSAAAVAAPACQRGGGGTAGAQGPAPHRIITYR